MSSHNPDAKAPPFEKSYAYSVSRHRFHRIAFTDWGRQGTRGTVVCVHGLTRQGRDFDAFAQRLATAGYRVICPDLAGRGQSDWLSDPHSYDLPQYIIDMHSLLASVGAREVTWVGFSLGGLIGIAMAGMENSPITRLVVNDIGPDIPVFAALRIGHYVRDAPTRFASEKAVVSYFREILAPFGRLSEEQWRHLAMHSVSQVGGVYTLNYDPKLSTGFRHPALHSDTLWKLWTAIEAPILVLRGVDSDIFPKATAQRMVSTNQNAQFLEFPDCGHLPMLMNAEQALPVFSWLEKTERGGSTGRSDP